MVMTIRMNKEPTKDEMKSDLEYFKLKYERYVERNLPERITTKVKEKIDILEEFLKERDCE